MASRDLSAARAAAAKGDAAASRAAHDVTIQMGDGTTSTTKTDTASAAPAEAHTKAGELMKSMLFGGLDGIITTFAVVAGAGGGGLSVPVVLIMGFSSLIADALSMGVGDALSSKAETEVAARERKREAWELENYPEGEKREMVELYVARGIPEDDATTIVETMAKHKEFFIDVMMRDELGMDPPEEGEGNMEYVKSGAACFTSFLICGSVPLLGYVAFVPAGWGRDALFALSCCLTALTLFVLGALKSKFTLHSWYVSGLEVLLVGGSCAAAAYLIGWGVEEILLAMNVQVHGGDPAAVAPAPNATCPP